LKEPGGNHFNAGFDESPAITAGCLASANRDNVIFAAKFLSLIYNCREIHFLKSNAVIEQNVDR